MILGPRPSLGWIGYLLIGRSWTRMLVLILGLIILSLALLKRSEDSIKLNFTMPPPFLPSVIILTSQDAELMNAFDACAVESATTEPAEMPVDFDGDPVDVAKQVSIYVYFWDSELSPLDYWGKVVSGIDGVLIRYMDIKMALQTTPIEAMLNSGMWGNRPAWNLWAAAGASLLWRSGGVLLPMGVLTKIPISLNEIGGRIGIIVGSIHDIEPSVFGAPFHHPIVGKLLENINKYDSRNTEEYPLNNLYTKSVKEGCNSDSDHYIEMHACDQFEWMDTKSVGTLNMNRLTFSANKDETFLYYTGNNDDFDDPRVALQFFSNHSLKNFCPNVFNHLQNLVERKDVL